MATAEKDVAAAAAKIVEVVTMTDGRKVEFPGKRRLLKDYTIDGDNVTCVFDFRTGETRSVTINRNDPLALQYIGHGCLQKVGDETAGLTDVGDMVLEVDEVISRLNNGEWNVRREGSGMAGTSILIKALVEYAGGRKTVQEIKEFLKDMSQKDKMDLRTQIPEVKAIVERLEAERASTGTGKGVDALRAGLATLTA